MNVHGYINSKDRARKVRMDRMKEDYVCEMEEGNTVSCRVDPTKRGIRTRGGIIFEVSLLARLKKI